MQWHYNLRHIGFQWLLQLSQWNIIPYQIHKIDVLELKCASCHFSYMKFQSTAKQSTKFYPQREGVTIILKSGHLKQGSKVSMDQFEIRVRGQNWSYHGKKVALEMLPGGTIFYDYASLVINPEPQLYLNVDETIKYTRHFEYWSRIYALKSKDIMEILEYLKSVSLRNLFLIRIKLLPSVVLGPMIRTVEEERTIWTVVWKYRVMILHMAIRCPDKCLAKLWTMALDHSAHLHNKTRIYDLLTTEAGQERV